MCHGYSKSMSGLTLDRLLSEKLDKGVHLHWLDGAASPSSNKYRFRDFFLHINIFVRKNLSDGVLRTKLQEAVNKRFEQVF